MTALIEKVLQAHKKDDVILTTFSGTFTMTQLAEDTERYIRLLAKQDLRGKKVGVLLPQIHSFLAVVMAVNYLGGIVVPFSAQYRSDDLRALLAFIDPHLIFTVTAYNGFSYVTAIEDWARRSDGRVTLYATDDGENWDERQFGTGDKPTEEGMDFIICTSGSTGMPKGIVHTLQSFEYTITQYCADVYQVRSSDRLFVNAPPNTYFGFASIFAALYVGAKVVALEKFDIQQLLQLLRRTLPNRIVTTPSIMKAIYTFAHKLAPEVIEALKVVALGGEVITDVTAQELPMPEDCRMIGMYGSTEMGGMMVCADIRRSVDWTIYPGVTFALGEGTDDIRECLIRAPGRFVGYYKSPELTREAFTEDGLFLTGDLVRMRNGEQLEIVGRKKDMIKKGGQQVVPGEIEKLLAGHSSVKQAVVVGAPHPVYGEQIVAFVVTDGVLDAKELYAYCADRIAGYKVPDAFRRIEDIPILQGKADKVTLRRQFIQS